jgi:hypothetical protein
MPLSNGPARSSPRRGRFFVQINEEPGTWAEICFDANDGDRHMSHWRKRNPPARQFNALLGGWSIAFLSFFMTLVALSLRGHV